MRKNLPKGPDKSAAGSARAQAAARSAASPPANLARQGSVVALMTVASRISGFVRDVALSHLFGAGAAADAFFVAFRIPNFFRRLFAEGAFAQAFVPVLADYHQGPKAVLQRFVQVMAGNLAMVVGLLSVLGVLGAPLLVFLFAPGFADEPARALLTTELVRITFPYLAFISLTAFAGALLNSHGRFAVPAFTPVLLNLTLIVAALVIAPQLEEPVFALAWGVFVAGVVQLLFQLRPLSQIELLARLRIDYKDSGARRVGQLLLPAVLASSASQINSLIDVMLASTLATGSISWLYYADRLLELPVGLVAVALGTVLLPRLSQLAANTDTKAFAATLAWGLRMAIFFGLPAAAALWLLAIPLVSAIFFHGAMTTNDVLMAALAVQAFSVGLVGMLLVKVLTPGYFSRKDSRTPLRFAFIAVLVNIALNLALFRVMGHVGLAFATSCAAVVNGSLLLRGLVRAKLVKAERLLLLSLLRSLVGCVVMVIVLVLIVPTDEFWLSSNLSQRWLQLGIACFAGGLVYLLVLLLTGARFAHLKHQE